MAIMIPATLPSGTVRGETQVFEDLRNDPLARDWYVLHSLDVAEHRRNISGELDFVVIVPHLGILCIEVKSHSRIATHSGDWFLGDSKVPERSPFRQVSDSMHSLRKFITDKAPDLRSVVCWSVVVFPFATLAGLASPEWHSWQLIDKARLRQMSLAQWLLDSLKAARKLLSTTPSAKWLDPASAEPQPGQAARLARLLRPEFETVGTASESSQRLEAELQHYTDQQLYALDVAALMTQVLYVGPAGTGKTYLAMEAARRAARQGKKVLLLCFNRFLAQWLTSQVADVAGIRVASLHQLMRGIAHAQVPDHATDEWWNDTLPQLALDALITADPDSSLYDVLILDEAQDLLLDSYLDVLDLLLHGGLRRGEWKAFGDFVNQQIFLRADSGSPLTILEQRTSGVPRIPLRDNCRNTSRITAFVSSSVSFDPGYTRTLRPARFEDPVPRLQHWERSSQQLRKLAEELNQLLTKGYAPEDIVILSPVNDSAASRLSNEPEWTSRLGPWTEARSGRIRYTTIHSFKGLESPVVVVTDITQFSESAGALYYVAATRAQHHLVVLAHESLRAQLRDLIVRKSNPSDPK